MWVKPQLLLMDEPTNFLDAQMLGALVEAIQHFDGGIAVVSHNHEFLRQTCNELWHVHAGHVSVPGKELHLQRLEARLAREREKQDAERRRLGPTAGWEMDADCIGRIIHPTLVAPAFSRFIALPTSLPEHALEFAVLTFLDAVEEKKPETSVDWLEMVITGINAAESIGFEEMCDMDYIAPIAVALLRSLLAAGALGSKDGGEALLPDQVHSLKRRGGRVQSIENQCRAMRWRIIAKTMEECCYCGKSLNPAQIQDHKLACTMSPERCGRRLDAREDVFEMFHGTSEFAAAKIENEGFQPSVTGMLGPGVYCSRDLRKARAYGRVVFLLHVTLGRVIKIDRIHHPLRTIWQTPTGGLYDCAWVPPKSGVVASGLEENCVRLPSQIKVIRRVRWDEAARF